jgi:hypothetical protein
MISGFGQSTRRMTVLRQERKTKSQPLRLALFFECVVAPADRRVSDIVIPYG